MRLAPPRQERRHHSPRLAVLFILGLTVVTGLAILYPRSVLQPAKPLRVQLPPAQRPPASQAKLVESYGKLPLAFEVNQGQTDSQVKFISRGRGFTMFLTGSEAVLALRAGNQREKGKGQRSEVEAHAPTLLKSPSAFLMGGTPNQRPTTNAVPIDNPQSSIDNSPTPSTLRMRLVGANSKAKVAGLDELPGKSNYFIGNDPKKWRTNVSNYAKVKYEGVYPGIDLVYYGNPSADGQLEYDWVVAPGADPKAIAFDIVGAGLAPPTGAQQAAPLRVDPNGDLVISTGGGDVRFHKPVVYQPSGVSSQSSVPSNPESRTPNPGSSNSPFSIHNSQFVDGRFVLLASNQIGFEVANYNKELPLVIDPVLTYSTYLGGSDHDVGNAIAVDSSGNAYVTGKTLSVDFPAAASPQPTYAGGWDAFVVKVDLAHSALVYSTYLGGFNDDEGYGIAVDPAGNACVTGGTYSADFPTSSPFQLTGATDAFVTKLNPAGSALVYSTYLGGSKFDAGYGVAMDSAGNAYVTGGTWSTDFPTANPLQASRAGGPLYNFPSDAFVTKLNAAGSTLLYSTYLGGGYFDSGLAIAVDSVGNAYITGVTNSVDFPIAMPLQPANAGGYDDAFVAKLNAAGSALVYSTYLGGSGDDYGQGVDVDSEGNAYVTGKTQSYDFPTANPLQASNAGYFDAFVTKLNTAGSALVYSTYLGGNDEDDGRGIAVDGVGDACVTGETRSPDFPAVNSLRTFEPGVQYAFVTKMSTTGSALVHSTYLGGNDINSGYGIALDSAGNAYVTGWTYSTDFPTANPLQASMNGPSDAFVAKLIFVPAVALSSTNLIFSSQLVTSTSSAQTVTLTNAGDGTMTIGGFGIGGKNDGDFAETSNCESILAPLAKCAIAVEFAPLATGIRSAALGIASNAPGSPHTIGLTGTGTDFAVGAQNGGATSATVTAGGTTTYNLQVTPTGFSGTVALACAFEGSTPRGARCSVSPGSVTVNGVDPAAFAVNVATTARSMAGPQVGVRGAPLAAPQVGDRRSPLQPGSGARHGVPLLLGLMLLVLTLKSRRVAAAFRPAWGFARLKPASTQWVLAAALLAVLLWAACGGESGGTTPPPTGTPAGTYNLTLTATAGGVSKTSTLTLKVN